MNPISDRAVETSVFETGALPSELSAICPTELERFSHVFVDFFDTIVTRKVLPERVKQLWASRVIHELGLQCSPSELYLARRAVELELCRGNLALGFDDDFQYSSFCQLLYEEVKLGSLQISHEEFSKTCKTLEVEVEKEVQVVCPNVLGFLKRLARQGKKLILVSDFYLPGDAFSEILKHHNIFEMFERVFVSSDFLLAKRSGRLYDKVLEATDLRAENAFMIGDNYHSDFVKANERGLKSIHLRRGAALPPAAINGGSTSASQEIDKVLRADYFGEFPLTLLLFIRRLHRRAVELRDPRLCFLSREGQFLRELFTAYQDGGDISHKIETSYFYASRKGTFLATRGDLNTESFETLFRQYRSMSLLDFLNNLGFSDESLAVIVRALGRDAVRVMHSDLPTTYEYRQLLELAEFRHYYELQRTEQRELLNEYVRAHQKGDELVVVDVGWKGTIQDNLSLLHGTKITGLYLGLVAMGGAGVGNAKEGLLFSLPDKTPHHLIYMENTALFEVLLGADHGSLIRYQRGVDGAVVGQFEHNTYESELFTFKIGPLQQQFIKSFVDLMAITSRLGISDSDLEELVHRKHSRMVLYPRQDELEFFSRLQHWENFGHFHFTCFHRSRHPWPLGRIRNLRQLLRDPRSVLNSTLWPLISLNNTGLACLSPVYSRLRYFREFEQEDSEVIKGLVNKSIRFLRSWTE
jgi:HAD superfamily hydrolase (TIGR01549 family)